MSEGNGAVSVEDVRHVADLANLELTAEELPRMAKDLNAVLGYIAQSVEPMAQVGQALGLKAEVGGETLRADEVRASVDRGAVMASAPETDGRFFKVPKVIER
jgi:aspartyl-tRNA(Asn)/glutamyl-tRNA(Gln) amidotransferase subunit C